jgi:hypothetical protein
VSALLDQVLKAGVSVRPLRSSAPVGTWKQDLLANELASDVRGVVAAAAAQRNARPNRAGEKHKQK